MRIITRAKLRGKKLDEDCYRARCSGVEYVSKDGDEYHGCYGLMDRPYNYNDECLECMAFVENLTVSIYRHICQNAAKNGKRDEGEGKSEISGCKADFTICDELHGR